MSKPFVSAVSFLAAVLAITFLELSLAWSQTPPQAAIQNVRVNGSGCGDGEFQASLSPDLTSLSLLFDNYKAAIGNGVNNLMKDSKSCQISMDIQTPNNWQFAFKAVDYRGYVQLPSSATALHRLTYVNSQQLIVSLREASFNGPINEDYIRTFEQRPERYVWSPCGASSQKIQFVSQLGIQFYPRSTDRSAAEIVIDSSDMNISQNISMVWRECTPIVMPPSGIGRPPITPRPAPPVLSPRPRRYSRY